MNNNKINSVKLCLLVIAVACTHFLYAQSNQHQLLVRDSLDYKENKLSINSANNEFSPISYKGGLLYVSNKPSLGRNNRFNRVYWSADPKFKIIEGVNGKDSLVLKLSRFQKSDDFTAPTSNDNDILVNYRKVKNKFNKVEQEFITFSTDQAFAFDDSTRLIVYAKKRKMIFGGVAHWELWQANVINGQLRNKHRILFEDRDADYLYPFIDQNGERLYFASNKKGGQGGFDIYYVNKEGIGFGSNPIAVSELNTANDDIAYFKKAEHVYFSSNRVGGMGGFDIYELNQNKVVNNLGYPINTLQDEVSLQKINNDFYLTTNRNGNFDVYGATYAPVTYSIKGLLIYKNDSTIVPNHSMYYKDADTGITIDTLVSDVSAKYQFSGKPNRNYIFTTLNGDSVLEQFSIKTIAGQTAFDYITPIGGRSPKQRTDSINALIAANEKRILDSIEATGITTKFVVHYGFNKYTIDKKEKVVLNYLLTKLKSLPHTYIAIGAFTDCIGSNKYNYKLSVKRAKSVYNYLVSHGLNKKQILTNGYAKKFNITPCITKSTKNSIKAQSDNRRAEIVLSNEKDQNWEKLEKVRGAGYYKIFNANSKLPTNTIVENTKVAPSKNVIVKQVAVAKPVVVKPIAKKDTVAKVAPVVTKKDTITKPVVMKPVVKKDTVAKITPVVAIKDTIAKKVVATKPVAKKDTVVAEPMIVTQAKQAATNELSKEEILKALDSLAKLKIEQERIVAYLTLRINNKPIDVYVSSDSVTVELYDNGVHDQDSVSVIYNNRIVVDRQELKVNQPIKFKLKVDSNMKNNELVMVAENLGTEPPNTAVMFITEKSGKRQQIILNTDMTHNGVVYFIRIGKQ